MTDIVVVSLLSSFVCRVVVPSIFKNVRRRKRSLINGNLKKYPSQIQCPVTDLKMEFLAKIVNNFKL